MRRALAIHPPKSVFFALTTCATPAPTEPKLPLVMYKEGEALRDLRALREKDGGPHQQLEVDYLSHI